MTTKHTHQRKEEHRRMALRVVFFYILFASLWILLSDTVVDALFKTPELLSRVQTIKGWVFVGVTGGLLYLYLNRCLARMRAIEQSSEAKAQQQFRQMETLFGSFNAIIYLADMQNH